MLAGFSFAFFHFFFQSLCFSPHLISLLKVLHMIIHKTVTNGQGFGTSWHTHEGLITNDKTLISQGKFQLIFQHEMLDFVFATVLLQHVYV